MKKNILLSLCLLCILHPANAQWQQTAGPKHHFVSGVAQFGSNLYATSREAMYTRPIGASDWQAVVDTPADFYPNSFFQIGNRLFAHSVLGLYRSDDGAAWESVSPNPDRYMYYRPMGNLIFAAERFQSPSCLIYRSEDAGQTWDTVLSPGNINQPYFFLGNIGGSLFMWFQTTNVGTLRIFKSTDMGQNWADLGLLPISNAVASFSGILQVGDRIFAPGIQLNPGVHWTDDGGLNWTFSNAGLPASGWVNPPTLFYHGNVIFLRAEIQNKPMYYRSLNGGQTWSPIAAGLKAYSSVLTTSDAIYLVADFNQLYRSTDDGQTWAHITNFPAEADFKPVYIWESGSRVALHGEGGIYLSTDNGLNWSLDRNGMLPYELAVQQLFKNNDDLFALTYSGLHRSSDEGDTWELLHNGFPQLPAFYYDKQMVATPSTLLVGAPAGIFRSTDNGATWQETFLAATMEKPYLLVKKGGSQFVLTLASNKIYRSDDEGAFWSFVYSLPVAPYSFFVATDTKLVCGGGNSYLVSDNNGATWEPRSFDGLGTFSGWEMTESAGKFYVRGSASGDPFVGISTDAIVWEKSYLDNTSAPAPDYEVFAKDSVVIATFYPGGIYFSKNYGQSWQKIQITALNSDFFFDFELDDTYLYGGTSFYGVWRTPLSSLIDVGVIGPVSESIVASVYPNPLKEHATLTYTLPAPAEVLVTLNDLSGKEIAVLANGSRESGPVSESLTLPSMLLSGNYLLKISAGQGKAAVQIFVR